MVTENNAEPEPTAQDLRNAMTAVTLATEQVGKAIGRAAYTRSGWPTTTPARPGVERQRDVVFDIHTLQRRVDYLLRFVHEFSFPTPLGEAKDD